MSSCSGNNCGGFNNVDHQACSGTGRIGDRVCRPCNGMGYRVVAIHCECCGRQGNRCTC